MRFFCLFACSLLFFIGASSNTHSQNATQPLPKPLPKQSQTNKELSNEEKLDNLFQQLQKQANPLAAKQIAKDIWQQWQNNSNPTVNLLAKWARDATDTGNYITALDLLDQVIILDPKFAEGWNQRATIHFLREDYAKSIADIEQTLKLEPRHFGALSGLGSIQQTLGKEKDALQSWYQALRIYPAMTNIQNAIINLEEKLQAEKNNL